MPRRPTPLPPPVWRLLPANLDLDAHLAAWPPSFAPFHRDCLVQLLHELGERLAERKRAAQAEAAPAGQPARRRGFAPLNAARLQGWLHGYRAYLDYAVASGLILEDARYSNGRYCRAFRFAAPYRRAVESGGPGARVVITKRSLLRALHAQRQRPGAGTAAQHQALAGVLGWLEAGTTPLRIDAEAARAAALALFVQRQQTPEEKLTRRGVSYRYPRYKDATLQYRQDVLFVGRLEERDLRPGFDQQGRLYTALAGMSKRMRHYVRVEGYGKLMALDLKNSQPYFINALLNKDFYSPPAPGRLTLAEHGGLAGRALLELDPQLGLRLSRLLASAPPDVAEFGIWTSSGQFYERLQAALTQAEPGRAQPRSREALKGLLLGIMYGRLDHQLPRGIVRANAERQSNRQVFAAALPTVATVLDAYKRCGHRALPLVLQSVEASLVLGVVARRVSERWPQIPIFTIHDSVLVPVEYEVQIAALLRYELRRAVGYEPQLGRTVYTPNTVE